MTKKLEELFFGESDNEEQSAHDLSLNDIAPVIDESTLANIEKIEAALPMVKGLEASDNELDELGNLAKDAFNNLLDLGMQVDSRFSAEIFNSASSMLGHALTAKTAKINKKLKMLDLQIKKAELDRKISVNKKDNVQDDSPIKEAQVIDRNELLKMIMSNNSHSESNKKDK